MSERNSSSASGGIGFFGLLQIVFIVLKLCKVIDWSWWWVMAPTWGSFLFVVALLLFVGFCFLMARFTGQTKRVSRNR